MKHRAGRAVVTGSAGFLGRHLAAGLEQAGYAVLRIDGVSMDAGDFFRYGTGFAADVAIHCAAVGADRQSIDSSPLALAVNFELDAALFRWAAEARPRRVVYISSSAAYPVLLQRDEGQRVALKETFINPGSPQQPDGIYGWAKLTGERLAALARDAGVPVSIVRPFSGYGEDQGTRFPFRALAARAQRREDPFTVWGSGSQVRDFIHVDDIVAAIMVMVREGIDGPVNLGTGRGVTAAELAGMFCTAEGYAPEIKPTGEHEGVSYRVADTSLMEAFYVPKVDLALGIRRILA